VHSALEVTRELTDALRPLHEAVLKKQASCAALHAELDQRKEQGVPNYSGDAGELILETLCSDAGGALLKTDSQLHEKYLSELRSTQQRHAEWAEGLRRSLHEVLVEHHASIALRLEALESLPHASEPSNSIKPRLEASERNVQDLDDSAMGTRINNHEAKRSAVCRSPATAGSNSVMTQSEVLSAELQRQLDSQIAEQVAVKVEQHLAQKVEDQVALKVQLVEQHVTQKMDQQVAQKVEQHMLMFEQQKQINSSNGGLKDSLLHLISKVDQQLMQTDGTQMGLAQSL